MKNSDIEILEQEIIKSSRYDEPDILKVIIRYPLKIVPKKKAISYGESPYAKAKRD